MTGKKNNNVTFGDGIEEEDLDTLQSDEIQDQIEREELGLDLNSEFALYREAIKNELHFKCQQTFEKLND